MFHVVTVVTVAQGMLLSLYLGEWQHATKHTRYHLRLGLGWAALGIGVLMASSAV